MVHTPHNHKALDWQTCRLDRNIGMHSARSEESQQHIDPVKKNTSDMRLVVDKEKKRGEETDQANEGRAGGRWGSPMRANHAFPGCVGRSAGPCGDQKTSRFHGINSRKSQSRKVKGTLKDTGGRQPRQPTWRGPELHLGLKIIHGRPFWIFQLLLRAGSHFSRVSGTSKHV